MLAQLRKYIIVHVVAVVLSLGLALFALMNESNITPPTLKASGFTIALFAALLTLGTQGLAVWHWATLRDKISSDQA